MFCYIKKTLGKLGILKILKAMQLTVSGGRKRVSKKYIQGNGLEIGALHQPLWLKNDCQVHYVDRLDNEKLAEHYPEVLSKGAVKVDIVDNGEKLATIANESQNFIIANHFIEHCENPIRTIQNHLAKLKNDGILYYAIPDKRFSFDRYRELTSFEHIERDYQQGETISRNVHYREWVEKVSHRGQPAHTIEAIIKHLENINYSIHFHCWNKHTLTNFFKKTQITLNKIFEICLIRQNFYEIIVVLRKRNISA